MTFLTPGVVVSRLTYVSRARACVGARTARFPTMPPTPPISTGAHDAKYEPVDVKTLGQGNFGTAKLMRHRASGQLFAIKYIERGDKIDENVKRELVNHRLLDHPNIIRFVEVLLTPTHLAIVMEYAAGGELFDRICGKGRFHEDEARFFFQQLISGLSIVTATGWLTAT